MVNYQYNVPGDKGVNAVRYTVGQPMGLYSSWPAMALTNHVLVRLAALRARIESFESYMIIGDDVVIWNSDVSKQYLTLIEEIGVGHKPNDSIIPTTSKPLEIAKRIFRNGTEVSPIPLNLWRTNESLFYWSNLDRTLSVLLVRIPHLLNKKAVLAAMIHWYFSTEETWNVPTVRKSRVDFPLPDFAHQDNDGNIVVQLPDNIQKKDQINWFLFSLYCNEVTAAELSLISDVTDFRQISDRKLIDRVNKFTLETSQRNQKVTQRKTFNQTKVRTRRPHTYKLTRSWIPFYREVIKSLEKVTWSNETATIADSRYPLAWVDRYRGYSDHLRSNIENVIVTHRGVTNNPWLMQEHEWILKWERQLSNLTDTQVQQILRELVSKFEEKSA
jgi:hypothetical protein